MDSRLGDAIYPLLTSSRKLRSLFAKLLTTYSKYNFGMEPAPLPRKEINSLLKFASLLAESNDPSDKIIAEEIVALLSKLHPDDELIAKTKSDVLASCTNYIGLAIDKSAKRGDDIFQELAFDAQKMSLAIPCQDGKFFFEDQKRIFDNFDRFRFVSYSAPTSLGKSFLMRSYIKWKIATGVRENFAIIVPTKALINEMKANIVEDDLKDLLRTMHYREVSSVNEIFIEKDDVSNFIFVMTPERLHYLLNSTSIKIDCCFIDESYKMSEPDSRSLYYFKVVSQLLERNPVVRIHFSSPNIPNPGVYLDSVMNQGPSVGMATTYSPVSQIKYIVSLKEKSRNILVFDDLSQELLDTGIPNGFTSIEGVISSTKSSRSNIVYCSGKKKTIELAIQYADSLPSGMPKVTDSEREEQRRLDELADDIENNIHQDYYLAKLVRKGIAYHVGYLPNTLRAEIEKAFKSGLIKTIFCTSTLMEGVNLPADNLFVTSTRNGNTELTSTAFKNLLGRIGRINYNLYGNVYLLIIPNYANAKTYEKLLKSKVEPQTVSPDKLIKDGSIVEHVSEGNYSFGKSEEGQAKRIAANIFINDVKSNSRSLIRERIEEQSNDAAIAEAGRAITALDVSESIDISPDQHVSLKEYIARGGHYPAQRNGRFDHKDVKKFLDELSDIYKWDDYEFEEIKHGDATSYYATVLSQWMSGFKVKEIVERSIENKRRNPYEAMYDATLRRRVDYTGSVEQKNEIINDTLKTIEQTILFTIANYFREFSREYKRYNNLEYIPNDWYEYVEFGTCNPITISLQRNGYNRDNAKWINEHAERHGLIDMSRSCKFAEFTLNYDALLDCGNQKVIDETLVIKLNVPELFR